MIRKWPALSYSPYSTRLRLWEDTIYRVKDILHLFEFIFVITYNECLYDKTGFKTGL